MKTNILLLSVILLTMASCGNSRRPGLSDKELLSLEMPERPDMMQSINFSDSIPSGVKYTEERGIDAAEPPIVLNLHTENLEKKNFNPADYYNKVSYVKIKHPLAEEGGTFTRTWGWYFGAGGRHIPLVTLSDKYIFVSDFMMGLFCYDAQGNFLDTIAESSYLKSGSDGSISANKTGGVRMMDGKFVYTSEITGYLGAFSVVGDDCLFLTLEGEVAMMNFYHIPTKTHSADIEKDVQKLNFQNFAAVTVPPRRPYKGGSPILLDKMSYIIQTLDPLNVRETFLSTFGIQGDTLCMFRDNVPKVKVQTAVAGGADLGFSYTFNGQHTVRQQYCDTVFRLMANNRLKPVYVLDFGEKRLDKRTGLVGDKSGKLMLYKWKESNQFIYIVFTENYVCPNTIEKKEVKFFYRLYDKRDKKLYQIPTNDVHSIDLIVENSLPNGLPFNLSDMNLQNDMLYTIYSKTELKNLMEHKTFSSLPEAQKTRAKQHYDTLNEDELLIMKLEK